MPFDHLGCPWRNPQWLPQFFQLAQQYSDDIVGIDLYGSEDDCREEWQHFLRYRKWSNRYHLFLQATITQSSDEQLLADVVKGLGIQRLADMYWFLLSRETKEDLLIKHGIHLIVCPVSTEYQAVNSEFHRKWSTLEMSDHESSSAASSSSTALASFALIDQLQSEFVDYSLTSLSPRQHQQSLVRIYENLLDRKLHSFTCEHVSMRDTLQSHLSYRFRCPDGMAECECVESEFCLSSIKNRVDALSTGKLYQLLSAVSSRRTIPTEHQEMGRRYVPYH